MTREMKQKAVNYVLFQLGWLACVWGAAAGYPWLSIAAILPAVILHLAWAYKPLVELRLLALCAAIGIVFDAGLLATSWVAFPNGNWIPGLAPYWMMILWIFLGTTLNLSMAWMKGRHLLAFLLGAIGGPLAYLAGERLGGIELLNTTASMAALSVGWGIIMPLLAGAAGRLNGFRKSELPDIFVRDNPLDGVSQNA